MTKQVIKSERIDARVFARKLVRDFRVVSHRILHYATRGTLRFDFMRVVSNILIDFSGCDVVELRLKSYSKCYSLEVKKNSRKVSSFEIMNCVQNKDGELIPCLEDNSGLECLCKDIFFGTIDLSLPFFSSAGSFWSGDLKKSFDLLSESYGKIGHYKIGKNKQYRSLILIPLFSEDERIGLMQLKSKQKDYFKKEEMEFYEDIGKTLRVALVHRRAQVMLRERVKELTCLYGISQVVEQPTISLDEILQRIVKLFPPAWLFPDITCARIVLDGKSYTSSAFQDTKQKQTADIIVDGNRRGVIEVIYTVEKPELDEGPFLKEERELIDTIAKNVAIIIERKQAEEEKLRLQEQLRHADRLATIGQLSAGVAHELNEPLANILGFAQLIKKYPKLPKQAEKDIERIVRASLHAREVIKKLMLFARQLPPQKTQVNLNQIVEDGLYFLESRCAKEGIKVEHNLSPDLPEITADPAQLTQVLVNLVVNSIQAMHEGGRITIETKVYEDYVSLIVEDMGVGISKNMIKKIFIPFFTTKEIGQGTGLGLSVIHGIVSSHGGKIDVDSEVGRGSRFEVKFPITVQENQKRKNGTI